MFLSVRLTSWFSGDGDGLDSAATGLLLRTATMEVCMAVTVTSQGGTNQARGRSPQSNALHLSDILFY